ncbi:MAG: hypothetical protein KDA24_01330 [Deltaproteobacteria bacterium]|nr:hypothetical protein [Deltaproteobacteria bacterium]
MFERTSQDFLLRQIQRFALGVLQALGVKVEDGEEDELDDEEAEALLGFPVDVVADMHLDGLLAFLARDGRPDPPRLLLTGMMLAKRAVAAEEQGQDAAALRVRALSVTVRAIEADPSLLTPRVSEVLATLARPSAPAPMQ